MPPQPPASSKPACPVKVSIRIRPEPTDENKPPSNTTRGPCITPLKDGKSIMLHPPPSSTPTDTSNNRKQALTPNTSPQTFNFDHVFPSSTSQSSVYESTVLEVRPARSEQNGRTRLRAENEAGNMYKLRFTFLCFSSLSLNVRCRFLFAIRF